MPYLRKLTLGKSSYKSLHKPSSGGYLRNKKTFIKKLQKNNPPRSKPTINTPSTNNSISTVGYTPGARKKRGCGGCGKKIKQQNIDLDLKNLGLD